MADSAVARPPLPPPLAATRTTPFWLPAAHFSTGLIFLLSAVLLLPTVAGDLAAGRFLQPRVVATTHLITLGWLTMSIMGALCQLFPVVLGTPLRWVKVAAISLAGLALGLALFVGGFLGNAPPVTVTGAILLSLALLLFITNAFATMLRAQQKDFTWWTLAGAFFFLLATITFGASLAANLQWHHLGEGRLTALAVHMHVALGGWVLLVIMAVARRLLPMFLLSHGTNEKPLRVAAIANATGVSILTLMHRYMTRPVFIVGVALMAIGVVALAMQVRSYVRTRHRPHLDPGIVLLLSGGAFVLIAIALGVTLLLTDARIAAAYGVALVGGFALFVAGHYYKILPFLLWNHRFAPLVGKRPLPRIADLYDTRIAAVAVFCSIAGLLGVLAGALTHLAAIAAVASLVLVLGIGIEAVQLFRLLRKRVD